MRNFLSGQFLLCLGLAIIGPATAPHARAQTTAHFDRDTISIEAGHSFINVLRLRDIGPRSVKLQLSINDSTLGGSWLTLPATIMLTPGEEKAVPVKYLASAAVIHEQAQAFIVRYAEPNGAITEARFYTLLNETPRILLQTPTPTIFIDPHTRKATAGFTIVNEGLLPLTLHLQLSAFPGNLQIADQRRALTLAAGGRATLSYDLQAPGHRPVDYSVVAECTGDSGEIYATSDIKVETLGNNKQVLTPGPALQNGNALELDYINLSPYYAYWQLRAQGGTGLPDSSLLRYKANIDYYDHPHGTMIYDSWLAYNTGHYALRLGGITDNLDYPINGNGIQASLLPDSNRTIDVFGLRNSYILYTDVSSQLPGADLIAGRYSYHTRPFQLQISVLHASDPVYSVYSNLLHTEARWQPAPQQEFDGEGGFSSESPLDRKGYHLGYSAGLRYRGQWPRLSLVLNNYFSSPFYSGYRRGTLQLDDETDWHTSDKDQLFIRYNKAYNDPKYTPAADSLVLLAFDYNNTTIYETGYRWHAGASALTLHPYELDQQLYSALASSNVSLRSASHRVALDYRYSNKGNSLFIGLDGGLTRTDSANTPADNYHSARIMGNLSGRLWEVNWLLQEHPYYLTDRLQGGSPDAFRLYSLGPGFHLSLLQDRLLAAGGYTLGYYSVSHVTTQLFNARVDYKLDNHWTANGQLYYTFYRVTGLPYPATQELRIGVRKDFLAGRSMGTIHLRLQLFQDKNSNGFPDPGEPPAAGAIVRLDGLSAISDARGNVVFTNLGKGVHTLTIDNSPEWNLPEPMTLAPLHDRTLEIPLVQSGVVDGRVFIERQQYEHRATDPEGVRIEARSPSGKVFITYTDARGRFRLDLPQAEYQISVHTQGAVNPGAVEQKVVVRAGATAEIDFRLLDRRRNIEVKQF